MFSFLHFPFFLTFFCLFFVFLCKFYMLDCSFALSFLLPSIIIGLSFYLNLYLFVLFCFYCLFVTFFFLYSVPEEYEFSLGAYRDNREQLFYMKKKIITAFSFNIYRCVQMSIKAVPQKVESNYLITYYYVFIRSNCTFDLFTSTRFKFRYWQRCV